MHGIGLVLLEPWHFFCTCMSPKKMLSATVRFFETEREAHPCLITRRECKLEGQVLGLSLTYARVFCRTMENISRRVLQNRGGASYSWYRPGNVCRFWLSGNCTRNPCRFLHPDKVAPLNSVKQSHNSLRPRNVISKRANEEQNVREVKRRISPKNAVADEAFQCRPSVCSVKQIDGGSQMPLVKQCNVGSIEKPAMEQNVGGIVKHNDSGAQKPSDVHNDCCPEKGKLKICEAWINNSCDYGDKCTYLHSWSCGNGFSKMVQLEGHQKGVTGINLPSGSDKLFTGSEDGALRIWNCHTGKCMGVVDMGAPIGCLMSAGPWVFAGLTNAVKAWNIEKQIELTLDAPSGRVYSLAENDGTLFAGLEDGSICVWKLNSDATSFEFHSLLKEHTGAVVSLVYGANRLYSGSMDNTIREWDLENMVCIHTLRKHSEAVTSVVCWEQYLLSSSLDKTLKVWAANEVGELEVAYTHKEEHGILLLCGMVDAAGNPILFCSCNDNSVRLYDLPSFVERGRIFAKQKVRTIHFGPGGLFFTGDGSGVVSVWNSSGF